MMKSWKQSWEEESFNRSNIDPERVCTFGIKCLDDVLFGILKKDFIVIGADSGIGKSEICLKIALNNARMGKKVGLYFIEGGDEEAIARIKWDLIRDKYYKDGHQGIDLDYRKWRMNMIENPIIKQLEQKVYQEMELLIGDNLMIYGHDKGLSIEEFNDSLGYFLEPEKGYEDDPLSYKHKVDLIIIDHLQYFTLTNPKNELTEQTEILKRVNEITHGNNIPVILVSHLRKKEKDRGIPNQEDFYGTSNTPKMASLAITLSSAMPTAGGTKFPTFFRFVKSRTKISSNYALLCNFNIITGTYDKEYSVYRLKGDKPEDSPLDRANIPKWAKGATTKAIEKKEEEVQVSWTD